MYDTKTLNLMVDDYLNHCRCHPTCKGLADWLHISTSTIYRAISGFYNGKPYGSEPHVSRCFATKDFLIIRGLFAKSCEYTQLLKRSSEHEQ